MNKKLMFLKLIFFLVFFTETLFSQSRIKLEKINGVYYLPCVVNGLNMKFIFDTGASDVSISLTEGMYMLKNGYLQEEDIISKEQYMIANGEIVEGLKINLKELKVGGNILKNVEASISSSVNAPLLLGQSALSKLGSWEFDATGEYIIINGKNFDIEKSIDEIVTYGCVSGDCNNGYGKYVWSNGNYNGMWKDGLKSGKGTYISSDGNKYEGDWVKNLKSGYGIFTYNDGNKYEGGYLDDLRHGEGRWSRGNEVIQEGLFDKNVYVGPAEKDIVNCSGNCIDGKGILYYKTEGDKYDGEFRDSKFHGQGTYTFANGNKYSGEFINGLYNGIGTFTFLDGTKYNGMWKDGLKSGKGTYISSDGTKYEGDFLEDKFHGQGAYTFPSGDKYIGGFKNNEFHGKGTYYWASGDKKNGMWENGKLIEN